MNKYDNTAADLTNQALAAKTLIDALRQPGDDPDEVLEHDMVEGETGLFEAIEVALDEIRNCEVIAAGIAEMQEKLLRRGSRVKGRQEKLRGLIEQAMTMADVKSHTFPCETVVIKRTPPKLVITDESAIPSHYFKPQPPKLDRTSLLKDAKQKSVEGVFMSNGGQTVQIRRT